MNLLRRKSDQDLLDSLSDADFWTAIREAVLPGVRRYFREALLMGMELGKTQRRTKKAGDIPVDVQAELLNSIVENTIDAYTDEWWAQFTSSQRSALRDAIQQSRLDGTGVQGVLDRVQKVIFAPARAETIAITEVTRLMGRGAQLQYQAAGYNEWEWRTAEDSFTCDLCAPMDGQRYPISHPFEPRHMRCRCWNVPAGEPS